MGKDMDLKLSELPDELVSNPQHPRSDFSAIGRNDYMIVLVTGEKVIPHVLESSLSEFRDIKAAIAFGDGQFELGVIVEPQSPIDNDRHRAFVSSIWSLIVEINTRMDGYAHISAPAAVVVLGPNLSLPRLDKGSIMRKETYRTFEEEIS
uniref:PKS-like protein n=1 Tax=Cladonia uncialis subsp. uncialis TaxID=180999 RepID=A0A1Z1C424_CLAUC|nr:putative type I PKS-like protein [Cladonia uncialis subsp. uncialis]AUW31046.1 PKS-like protein [Cladonia uncialis subsp. uncialis]